MASTITSAVLTVSVSESITLNGKEQGSINAYTVAAINEVFKRIITVPTSEITLLNFGTAVSAGTFDESKVRYIRITNKDNAHHVYLVFKNEYNNECCMKLDKAQSFIYNPDLASGVIDTILANQVPLGFTEATGETNNPTSDVVSITPTSQIIPGLRYDHDASGIPAGSSVGVITPPFDANDGYRATSHTLVSRHADTGVESAVSTSGPADTDGTGTYSAGFGDLVSITAEAETAASSGIDLEVFVAST